MKKETKQDAKIVLKLIGEEDALSLIAKKIKLQQ